MYSLASSEGGSKVKGKFDVAPLPGTPRKPGASSLGGHNAGISAYSDHKATALDFVKFLETEETQKWFVTQGSNAPALAALYDDPALIKEQPYLPTLKTSILNAVPRPVTALLPGRDQGGAGQRLRRDQGRQARAAGVDRHAGRDHGGGKHRLRSTVGPGPARPHRSGDRVDRVRPLTRPDVVSFGRPHDNH